MGKLRGASERLRGAESAALSTANHQASRAAGCKRPTKSALFFASTAFHIKTCVIETNHASLYLLLKFPESKMKTKDK
jgi:hypothetical protein